MTTIKQTIMPDGRDAVIKTASGKSADFFKAEARGLQELAKHSGLRVPEVLAVSAHQIVLEDLGDGARVADFWQLAAVGLAKQHQHEADQFGWQWHGYCGDSFQDNTLTDNGFDFFAEQRLLAQTRRAADAKLLNQEDINAVDKLCAELPDIIPTMPAVLLHGDLWSGNLHVCSNGEPALIDAGAVHYGWAEAELAMLCLFGEPPQEFFEVYQAEGNLLDDWQQRIPIYNLYHLLNHLNLFAGGYLGSVRTLLRPWY